LEQAPSTGLILEFGVFEGRSINWIARCISGRSDTRVFGFDSFEGLPENWFIGNPRGHYKVDTIPTVEPSVTLVKGLFQQTLEPFLSQTTEPVAFVHVDSDLYSSAHYVLETLFSLGRLAGHPVIVFDEYLCGPNWWRDGEYRALQEFVTSHGVPYRYTGYTMGSQVAMRL
jgi:hypothetical protein